MNFDWGQVRAFLATAEEGSLSAAARALRLTQPTLGRQVAALEEILGVTLFERSGRSLRLTQAGRDLLEPAGAMRDAALRFSLSAAGQSQSVSGKVTVTATDVVATHVLPPILAELRTFAPGIEVEIIASNTVQDLTRREADISIRHARPEQPDLTARLLGERNAFLYGAPALLDREGRPKTVDDLAHYDFVGFDDVSRVLPVFESLGIPMRPENMRVQSASGPAIAHLARAGLGLTMLTEEMADVTGGLEKVLPEHITVTVPVWLVTHRELHTAKRIRLVFDLLAKRVPEATVFN